MRKRREDRFVVGLGEDESRIRGNRSWPSNYNFITPLTLGEAKKKRREYIGKEEVYIYELVPLPKKKEKK